MPRSLHALAGALLVMLMPAPAAVAAPAEAPPAAPPSSLSGGTPGPSLGTAPAPASRRPASSGRALLRGRFAVAPPGAPVAVQRAVAAGNRLQNKPYVWGGGHATFRSRGYDCSGSVSFALHGAGVLGSPLASGPLMRWGARGPGRWITVYSNAGHVFMTVAGLRLDTSGTGGRGPRWHSAPRSTRGFVVRHAPGL